LRLAVFGAVFMSGAQTYPNTPWWTDRKAAYNKGFGNKLAGSCQLRLLVGYGSSVHAGRYAFGFGISFIKLFILHWAAVSAEEFQIPVHRQAQIVGGKLTDTLC